MLTAKQLGKQLITVISLGLLFIAFFNIINNYYTTKNTLEKEILEKLHAITRTASLEINGEMHEKLMLKHKNRKDTNLVFKDPYFQEINNILTRVKKINNLNTNIYTLFLAKQDSSSTKETLSFGVISGKTQYFRNKYELHPDELLKNFKIGGILPEHSSENGTWLSAFSPLHNSQGETIAVIQVDKKIDDFLNQVRKEAIINACISFLIILIIAIIMIFFVVKMVKNDRKKTELIKSTSRTLEAQNIKIKDSINYAQRIQNAIIPDELLLNSYYNNSFIMLMPKDIVSGDFPWVYKGEQFLYVAAIDCTGHGVPGAMVSFVGYFLLEKLKHDNVFYTSFELVKNLHLGVNKTLKQKTEHNHNNDGMDGAFCRIDTKKMEVCFSGAHRPLIRIRNNELTEFKGVRRGIGGTQYDNTHRKFTGHSIPLEKGDRLFIFSDGYADQFGGPDNKKMGSKKLKSILTQNLSMTELKQLLEKEFKNWQGKTDQTDDVLIIGVEV